MLKDQVLDFWAKRTPRERIILSITIAMVSVGFILPMFINPVVQIFAEQSATLSKLKKTYEATPKILKAYAQLSGKRRELEAYYKNADLSTDPLTHLEKLLRDTARADSSYNVTPREGGQKPEGKYIHKIFKVNFKTDSYPNLVAFLDAVTNGSRPMLIAYLKLNRSRFGKGSLEVEVHVSGFQLVSS